MSNVTEEVPESVILTEGYTGRLGGRLHGERWTVGPASVSKITAGEI